MSEEEFEKELKINDENWSKEIDRLREVDQNEIIKLRSIIKEVREYMALNIRVKLNEEFGETMQYKTIYEILDKEKKHEI